VNYLFANIFGNLPPFSLYLLLVVDFEQAEEIPDLLLFLAIDDIAIQGDIVVTLFVFNKVVFGFIVELVPFGSAETTAIISRTQKIIPDNIA